MANQARILIVEDKESNRNILRGCQIITFTTLD
jgi:hypothetical protein